MPPHAVDHDERSRLGEDRRLHAVDAQGRRLAPPGHAQIQRELGGFFRADRQPNRVFEWVPRLGRDRHFLPVADPGGDFRRRVEHGGQPVVGRGHPEMLGKVRPAVRDVVLAAAVAVRVVREHLAAVLQARRLVLAVEPADVRAGQVMQPFQVGRH